MTAGLFLALSGSDSFYRLEGIAQRLKVVQFGSARDQRTIWIESTGPGT